MPETGTGILNRTLLVTTAVLGITLSASGFTHGFYASLQGNTLIPGWFFDAIGPEHLRWEYGGEGAVTLIPNFLYTGIAAMVLSLAIAGWCLFGLTRRHGPAVLLGLFVALTLAGGGIGQIGLYLPLWGFATRIRKPLTLWQRLRPAARALLARLWSLSLGLSSALFLAALAISVTGIMPGVTDPDAMLVGIFLMLLFALVLLVLAFAGAASRDLAARI